MDFSKNIDTFVINLDSRKDRLNRFDNQMKRLNIKYNRFSAKENDDGLPIHGMTKGEIGCLASHYRLIEQAHKNNTGKYLCIFEDDAEFCDDFNDRFKYLSAHIDNYDWDIIYLSAFHHLPRNTPSFAINKKSKFLKNNKMQTFDFTDHRYIHKMHASFIMVGYIIKPSKIDKVFRLLNEEIKIKPRASDRLLMNLMEEDKINVYSYVPGMVTQYSDHSDIKKKKVNYTDYFKSDKICGAHVYCKRLSDFNYDKYFSAMKINK